jgi:tetratricopeptide (TPR) repeat protein
VVRLSEASFEERKYDDALCLVTVALECLPASASLHSMAGACHYQLKDPTLAVKEVQQAVYLGPANEDYCIQLAQIFIDYNTPDAAVLLLEAALSTFPGSARISYVLGIACLKSSQLRKADEYLQRSLRLEPRNPLTLRALAMLYEGEGKWAAVLELTDSMMQLPSQMYEGYYYRAEAKYNLARNQPNLNPEITGWLRKSVSLKPDFFPSHLLLGKILLAQGSYRAAIGSLERAVRVDPQSQTANYDLAMAYRKAGQPQKSAEAWKRFQVIVGREKNKPPDKTLSYEVVTEQPSKR